MSTSEEFENIAFDLPKNQSNVIKVIGVGGGGSNAINHMFQLGIKGVDFVICNTDAQALQNSGVPNKIQLGISLTEGLGAGANPEVGKKAAEESFEDIKRMLETNTKMVFITAGMGGGTGTGAAPIIARMAKEAEILTVGIVTMPFIFEGKMRNEQAQEGVEKLRKEVDSLIVINNNKLREVYGNLGFKAGFSKADEVLSTAARGIAEVITHHYTQNIDLRDAKTVLSNSGTAIMGSANAAGENRAQKAIQSALDSPLLNDNKITGAKNVLLLIVSGTQEITIDEIGEINDHIQAEAGHGANIIMGVGEDQLLEDAIAVTIIATGFNVEQQDEITNTETKKVIHTLEDEQTLEQELLPKKTLPIEKPIINQKPTSTKSEDVVKHTLNLEELEELNPTKISTIEIENELIETTPSIKNIPITFEELLPEIKPTTEALTTLLPENNYREEIVDIDEEFTITPINSTKNVDASETPDSETTKKQITLSFDLPISQTKDENNSPITAKIEEEDLKKIPVTDFEIVTATNTNETEEIRYALDAEIEAEKETNKLEEDAEIIFERKTITPEELNTTTNTQKDSNPLNSSISEILKERNEERRKKMKEFNYKFNHSKIDDIEKIPAYKRKGVDLEETKPSSEDATLSGTQLSTDENNEIQIRNNNSFLHDNVD